MRQALLEPRAGLVGPRGVEIDQGQIEMNYAGTVDGDVLSGKVKSQFGEFDLKGSRAN